MVIQKSTGAHLQCLRLWTGLTVIAWFALVGGGIFSCQVDSNNSKPAATGHSDVPLVRLIWWDGDASIHLTEGPEKPWADHRGSHLISSVAQPWEGNAFTHVHTHKPCHNQHTYLPRSMHANVRKYHMFPSVPYRLFCVLLGWVVHQLTPGNPCTSASTAQCIIFTQSTNKTQ